LAGDEYILSSGDVLCLLPNGLHQYRVVISAEDSQKPAITSSAAVEQPSQGHGQKPPIMATQPAQQQKPNITSFFLPKQQLPTIPASHPASLPQQKLGQVRFER